MPLDRYSADARRAVELATQEARRLRHGHVGTEHLLLGLLAQAGTAAASALAAGGASLALCREKVTEALATRQGGAMPGDDQPLPFSDRATRAVDRASRLAPRMGSVEVRPEHLLLSVLDVEGTAGQVLRGLSVDMAAVRQALASPSAPPPPAPEPDQSAVAPRPLCAKCGAALDQTLGQTTVGTVGVVVYYCTGCGAAIGAVPGRAGSAPKRH